MILAAALPCTDQSACNYGSVLCGVEMGYIPRPMHRVHAELKLITGFFPVAVCPALPIEGMAFLMGNDIAGGKVTPALERLDYFLDKDILMRKWCSFVETDLEWSAVYQIVVSSVYRHHVLSVAHESQWSGLFSDISFGQG